MKLERSVVKKITTHQNWIRNQALYNKNEDNLYIRGYYASCLLHSDCSKMSSLILFHSPDVLRLAKRNDTTTSILHHLLCITLIHTRILQW
jgi:hypothetical protein